MILRLLSCSGIKLLGQMSLTRRRWRLLMVKGWGRPYGMRVLDGPLDVFL